MKEAVKMDKKRKWVIRFAIIFLIVLALLTFFSQTIMNYSLTKVTAQYPEWSTIATSTRADGQLEAIASVEVKAIDNRKISEVHVNNFIDVRAGDVLYTLEPIDSSEELDQLKLQLEEIELERYYESQLPSHDRDYAMYEEAIEAAKLMVDMAKVDLNNAQNKNSIIQNAQSEINTVQALLISLEAEKEALIVTKSNLEHELLLALEALESVPDGDDDTFELAEVERLNDAIETIEFRIQSKAADEVNAQNRLNTAMMKFDEAQGYLSVSEAERQLSQAERNLTEARRTLSDQQAIDNVQDQRDRRARQQEDEMIEDMRRRIAELEDLLEVNEIRAPLNGLAYGFYASVGDEIMIDQVLGRIINESAGYKADFAIPRESASQLFVGSNLNSTDHYIDSVIVVQIRPDPNNPRDSSIVTATVSGDWLVEGYTINIWLDDFTQYYDSVLPNSAIHQDDTGTFVYVLQIKDGPLGERFYAQKTSVNILATDGRRSAVEPEAVRGRQIIVRSEKPLSNGEQVRLEDYRPED